MGAVQIGSDHWIAVWAILKALDKPDIQRDATTFLDVLSDVGDHLSKLQPLPTFDLLIEVFNEESLHHMDETLFHSGFQWLHHRLSKTIGRQTYRDAIKEHFQTVHAKPESISEPLPSVPIAHLGTTQFSPIAPGALVPAPTVLSEDTLAKANKRAIQLLQQSRIQSFDGIHHPEAYLVFKYQVQTLIRTSTLQNVSFVAVELLLATLRGPALVLARSVDVCNMSAADALTSIWFKLDSVYASDEANIYVANQFYQLRQLPHQHIADYMTKFQHVAAVMSIRGVISDSDLIVKFNSGLTDPVAIAARALIHAKTCLNFENYVLELLNACRTLEPLYGKKGTLHSAAIAIITCGVCGGPHEQDTCTKRVTSPCFHCQSMEHYSRACTNRKAHWKKPDSFRQNSFSKGVPFKPKYESRDIATKLREAAVANNTITVNVHGIQQFPSHLVDLQDPLQTLFVDNKMNSEQVQALRDTGAGANFISESVAIKLCQRGYIPATDIFNLETPLNVTYGNSTQASINTYVKIRVRSSVESTVYHSIYFFVVHTSSHELILGRPGLKCIDGSPNMSVPTLPPTVAVPMNSVSIAGHSESLITTLTRGDQYKLQISFPFMEEAHIAPYRVAKRHRSIVDERIIHAKLSDWVEEGKVSLSQSADCAVVLEVVLVDKKQGQVRRFPADDVKERYRVTLDLRPLNDMQLIQLNQSFLFMPREIVGKKKELVQSQQQQYSAVEMLKWFSTLVNDTIYYAKIDISEAYQGIEVPVALQRLFSYRCQTSQGTVYFRWNTLPQGWSYSPLYFSIAVEHILQTLTPDLKLINVQARHYQDDILLVSTSLDQIRAAVDITTRTLEKFSLKVNANKTVVSNSIVFCGYQVTNGYFTPRPKCPITAQYVSNQWQMFQMAKTASVKLNALRSWAGKFNYMRGFMPGAQLQSLNFLYKSIGYLMKELSIDEPLIKTHFENLTDYVLQGTPLFLFGLVKNTLCNIIVTDANKDSYAGILFKLCRADDKVEYEEPVKVFIEKVLSALGETIDVTSTVLVPIRLTGDVFPLSSQRQSSTYRERLSQLLAMNEFHTWLDTRCVIVTDNQNVQKEWQDVEILLNHMDSLNHGANFLGWSRFISCVDSIIWVPRTSPILQWTDELARCLVKKHLVVEKPVEKKKLTEIPCTNINIADAAEPSRKFTPLPDILEPFKSTILGAYENDATTYLGIPMRDVFNCLRGDDNVVEKTRNLSRRFYLHNGLMYHYSSIGHCTVYIPGGQIVHGDKKGTFRAMLLHFFHDTTIGLHRGYKKVVFELSQSVWWPSLLQDASIYTRICVICAEHKSRFNPHKGDYSSFKAEAPFHSWVVDFAGPIKEEYILVQICAFSMHVVISVVPDCQAETTAKCMIRDVITKFGIPRNVYSDRGTHFNNHLISEMCSKLSINWRCSASYSPRTQGLVERCIGHLKQCIAVNDGMKLEDVCQYTALLHNTTTIADLGFSPFEILYGFRPHLNPYISDTSDMYYEEDVLDLHQLRETFNTFRAIARDKTHDLYSLRSSVANFTVGQKVLRVSKAPTKVSGPHTILKVINPNLCEVSEFTYPIPVYQLKPLEDRPDHLHYFDNPVLESEEVDLSGLKEGQLILFENFEAQVDCYDLGRCTSYDKDQQSITLELFWFDTNQHWELWANEFRIIHASQVRYFGFKLIRGRIPQKYLKLLELI